MSFGVGKIGAVVFLALSGAMVGNMLLMQPVGQASNVLSVEPGVSLDLSMKPDGQSGASGLGKNAQGNLVILNSDNKVETTRAIQRELTRLGYMPGPADGTSGLMTRAAIMAFEFDNGLDVNGRSDPDLLKMLLFGLPGSMPVRNKNARLEMSKDAVRVVSTVQQTLQQLGYNVGKIDGEMGSSTKRAIRDFESDHNLVETGRVSGRLVAKMVSLAASGRLAQAQ